MKASLPRPLFPAIVLALAVIVLTPAPLLADAGMPWVFGVGLLMVAGLIPVILIEGFVLRRRMRLGWPRAIGVSTVANIASTVVGILAAAFGVPGIMPNEGATRLFVPLILLLVPLLFVSWVVEYPVAWLMLGRRRATAAVSSPNAGARSSPPGASAIGLAPPPSLRRGVFDANLASYAFLALAAGVFWVGNILHPQPPKTYPVGTLRTINSAEITYAATFNHGYSASLAALGPSSNGMPSESAADLISGDLAGSGVRSGYRFTYSPGPPDADGRIQTYSVSAAPLQPEWGNYYYTDQSGVIRQNTTAPASATDPAIGG
jgi:hypothetical protein